MNFLEKDLEDIIWESQKTRDGRDKLRARGLPIAGKMIRQFNLSEYGQIDLLTVKIYRDVIDITIYELKQKEVNTGTLLQACRYATGIKRLMEEKFEDILFNRSLIVNKVLIGSSLDLKSEFTYLYNEMEECEIYTYKYDLEGITFDLHDRSYHLDCESNLFSKTVDIDRQFIRDSIIKRNAPF